MTKLMPQRSFFIFPWKMVSDSVFSSKLNKSNKEASSRKLAILIKEKLPFDIEGIFL